MKWDEAKKAKIRKQILSKVEPFMKEVKILRDGGNVFKEASGPQYVGTFKGYLHKSNTSLRQLISIANTRNITYDDRFLIVVNDESLKIVSGDYFTLGGVKYTIIDKGNVEDIVFDTYIKKEGVSNV